MAHKCIKVLQKMGVECIVAPYEADAQLTFLSLKGYVAGFFHFFLVLKKVSGAAETIRDEWCCRRHSPFVTNGAAEIGR